MAFNDVVFISECNLDLHLYTKPIWWLFSTRLTQRIIACQVKINISYVFPN